MTQHLLPGEIYADPFERRHVGRDNAFILRVNAEHAERACAAIRRRTLDEVEVKFSPGLRSVAAGRKAA